MRRVSPFAPMAVLAGLALVPLPIACAQELSDWSNGASGFTDAMQTHDDEETPAVVYFYADWCGYCKRFNRALADDAIDLSEFVKVRINPEKGDAERALADRFGVSAYPSVFVIPAGSKQPRRVQTYGTWDEEAAAAFTQACRKAANL
jgi:thiol:disulfide interchange protein